MYLKHTHRSNEVSPGHRFMLLGSQPAWVETKPCVSPQHKDWSGTPRGWAPPQVARGATKGQGLHWSHPAVCTAGAETSFPSPTSSHAGLHAQAGNAESGCQLPETEFPSPAPGGPGQSPNSMAPLPLKCDGWAEFSWQFKHFALICVLVCILFWETNFETSFVCRPSQLAGALSSFRAGCSSDSRRAAARRPCCPWPPSITARDHPASGVLKLRWGHWPLEIHTPLTHSTP